MGLKKNYMIISVDAEKVFDKTQNSFMRKVVQRTISEDPYFNTMNALYNKHTVNILLNGERPQRSPIKIRNETWLPPILTPVFL